MENVWGSSCCQELPHNVLMTLVRSQHQRCTPVLDIDGPISLHITQQQKSTNVKSGMVERSKNVPYITTQCN